MTDRIEMVEASGGLADLMPIFARDHVPLVVDKGEFLGLITRIDLLNHLRRRMK